jgi:hypothetical protein
VIGSPTGKTGIWSLLKSRPMLRVIPKILIAPGMTSWRPTNGVSDFNITDPGSDYVQSTTNV